MKIKLSNGNELLVSFGKEKILSVDFADFSGVINFRKEVKNFLKREGRFVVSRSVGPDGKDRFFMITKEPLTTLDILKFACWLERRRNGVSKNYSGNL